ncbi:MAG: cupredoxin domain-containing protein [Candidatus Woesearchaeota archaeon]
MRVLAALLVIVFLAGCTTYAPRAAPLTVPAPAPTPSVPSVQTTTTPEQQQAVQVVMSNFKFVPNTLTISAGTEVDWINQDSVPHTVTIASLAVDQPMPSGAQYGHIFSNPGTYEVRCKLHPSMIMTVTVQ